MKDRVGDGKLMIISVTVSGIKMTIAQLDNYAKQFLSHEQLFRVGLALHCNF